MQTLNSLYSRKNTLAVTIRLFLKKYSYIVELLILALSIILPLTTFPKASAQTIDPDGVCSITNVHVNRNLVTSGDMLVTGQYKIPYANIPAIMASQAFIISLQSTDGSTEIGYNLPFVFFDNGYNDGAFSLYFPNGSAPTWGSAYILRVSENPNQFTSPQHWDAHTIHSGEYVSITDQTANQADLAGQIINLAHDLETIYNVQLLTQSTGTVLTSGASPNDGEGYFRGVVPFLQSVAPTLFLVQTYPVDLTATAWTTTQFDTYEHRYDGTWVGTDIAATATQTGVTPGLLMSAIVILPLCLAFILASSIKLRRAEPGYMICGLMLMMGVLMGWMPKAVFASIYQACGIYIAALMFYQRS